MVVLPQLFTKYKTFKEEKNMCVGNTQMKILNKTVKYNSKNIFTRKNCTSMITTDLHHSTSATLQHNNNLIITFNESYRLVTKFDVITLQLTN